MANGFYLVNTEAQAFLTKLGTDLGTSPLIKIYSGSVPADADATNAGTLLATLTCASTPFSGVTNAGGTPAKAQATFGTITSGTAAATGTAAFFRITTAAAAVVAQGTVGTASADLILNTTSITSGSTVAITSATITLAVGP